MTDKDIRVKANAVAYDESGNIIGAADGAFEVIGKGEEAGTTFTSSFEYDKEKYDRYECYYDAYGELVSN